MPRTIQVSGPDFVELMTEFQGRLFGYVMTLTGDPDAANDILQETNVVLWKQSRLFQPGSNFKAWAFRIAHFQFMAYRQRRLREKVLYSDELLATLAAEFNEVDELYEQRAAALGRCLEQIHDRSRQALRLRYTEELSVAEIAMSMRRTSNAISQLLFRARQWLVGCIKRHDEVQVAS